MGIHPWAGETKLNYTGPKPPFETLEGYQKYSFLKTPRWKEKAMEVGPLARLMVAYASGRTEVQELVGEHWASLTCPWPRCSPRWDALRLAAWMGRWRWSG